MSSVIGSGPGRIQLNSATMEQPWRWLEAGWRDLWRRPGISLTYGLAVVIVSYLIVGCLIYFDAAFMFLPLGAAFMLIGPMLAVGLYEASRRYTAGESVTLGSIVFVAVKSPVQLGYVGILLMLFLLAWVRIATLIFALFFGLGFPPLDELFQTLFFTLDGLAFLAVGTTVGAILAFTAFAISAISIPMLLEREVDAVSAILASILVVRDNFGVMLLWAWLIALITAGGLVTLFLGLLVTFPLIGHATWHAYRDLVAPATDDSSSA